MALISESDAIEILGDHIFDLREIMVAAWRDYGKYDPALRRLYSASTRAAIVHDHIKSRARNLFGLSAVQVNRLFVVVIGDRLVVRFKRFHADKTSSNIRTGQIENYRMQGELPQLRDQLDLFGELSHLEAGYTLDQFETEIRGTWLVCPSGLRANLWHHEIKDRAAISATPQTAAEPLFRLETTVRPKETNVVTLHRPDGSGES